MGARVSYYRARWRAIFRLMHFPAGIALLFGLIFPARAQYGYEVWTVDNGMPENEIRGITQTPDGYFWIATLNGLARLDGVHLTVFNRETPGLRSNQFGNMLQGRGGDLWLASVDRGLIRYHNGSFREYSGQDGVPDDVVNGVTGDSNGDVWLLSAGRIMRWDEGSGRFVEVAPRADDLLYRSLTWDLRGFWARHGDTIHCFSAGHFVDYHLPVRFQKNELWGAGLDQAGTLWIETLDGQRARIRPGSEGELVTAHQEENVTVETDFNQQLTMRVGPRLERTFEFVNANRSVSLKPLLLYEDRQANLWIGTQEAGLYRLQRQSIRSYSKEEGLVDRDTYAIYEDRSAALWIGAWHQGVTRYAEGKYQNFTMADGLPNGLATALFQDRAGTFWVGTHGGLTRFENGRFLRADKPELPQDAVVEAICEDRQGVLWFGTRMGLARFEKGQTRFFTRKDGLAANDIHVVVETANGDLWAGGNGGLTRIHNGVFTRWTDLPSTNIWSIYEDAQGILWIGTYDGGLLRYQNGHFTSYTRKDGLFDDGAFQTLEDAYGYLWISCSRGVYRVSKAELNQFAEGKVSKVTSTPYGKVDGMRSSECNGGVWPSGLKTVDGRLWFPTRDGVAVIDPAAVAHDRTPPSVLIESTLVDNVARPVGGPIEIPARNSNVEINYTAPNFINAAQTHFRYKLEGLDTDWVEADGRRTAYYSHLPPGGYTFQVIAGNSDGVWNETGKTLDITVLTPFYQTWWFQALMLLTLSGLAAVAWLYRVSQLKREQAMQQAFSRQLIASQEAERKRIAAEMHDSLGQRLVVIKNLTALLLRAKSKSAASDANGEVQTMTEISEEASLAIEETRGISYNLRPFQLDRLGLKKAIEAMVRTAGVASSIQFSTELDDIDEFFPEDLRINVYRIVQESLGNIMKHAQAKAASVRALKTSSGLTLTIEDDGVGFHTADRSSKTPGGGFGLTGIAERARLLGGELKLKSTSGRGTTIIVEFPRMS